MIFMPYSIVTCMDLKFVKESNLKTRMKFLEYSYKYQFASLFGISLLNIYPFHNVDTSMIYENNLFFG